VGSTNLKRDSLELDLRVSSQVSQQAREALLFWLHQKPEESWATQAGGFPATLLGHRASSRAGSVVHVPSNLSHTIHACNRDGQKPSDKAGCCTKVRAQKCVQQKVMLQRGKWSALTTRRRGTAHQVTPVVMVRDCLHAGGCPMCVSHTLQPAAVCCQVNHYINHQVK